MFINIFSENCSLGGIQYSYDSSIRERGWGPGVMRNSESLKKSE